MQTAVYDLSEMSCESRLHTLQMLELCRALKDKAEILYIKERGNHDKGMRIEGH